MRYYRRQGRRGKYNASKTLRDGIKFASLLEANRYSILKLQEASGDIRDLQLQVKYPIIINDQKICDYIADFRYFDVFTNQTIVEDAKGMRTSVYSIKKKLMKAVVGIEIKETGTRPRVKKKRTKLLKPLYIEEEGKNE